MVTRAINRLDDLRKSAGSIGAPAGSRPLVASAVVATSTSAPALILDVGGSAIASVLTFVMVTVFLLVGGAPMMARMAAAVVDSWKASAVQDMLEKMRVEVSHYYLVTSLINLGLGLAPHCWQSRLVAVMSFDTLKQVVGVAGTFAAFVAIEGQVVQPLLVGRHLEVNPLLIFLGLWFGGGCSGALPGSY